MSSRETILPEFFPATASPAFKTFRVKTGDACFTAVCKLSNNYLVKKKKAQ